MRESLPMVKRSMSALRRTAAGGVLRLKVDTLGSVGLSVIGSHGPVLSVRCQMRESLPMVKRSMSALRRTAAGGVLRLKVDTLGSVGLSVIGSHGPVLSVRCQMRESLPMVKRSMSALRRTAAGGVLRLKVDTLGSVGLSVIGSHGPVLSVRCQMRESLPMVKRSMSALRRTAAGGVLRLKVDTLGSVGLSVIGSHGPVLSVRCQMRESLPMVKRSMSALRRTAAGGVLRLKVDTLGSVGLSVIGSHGPVLSVRCQMRESLPMVKRSMSALRR